MQRGGDDHRKQQAFLSVGLLGVQTLSLAAA